MLAKLKPYAGQVLTFLKQRYAELQPKLQNFMVWARGLKAEDFKDPKKWAELNNQILAKIKTLPHSHMLTGQTKEHEFLPAALEIIETPPSPAARMISGSIVAFLVIALLWAMFGSVDIIATAPGKIVPTGRTKIIQPLDSGVVHAIHVQDGQHVKAGDVLIEIDTTISAAERDRLQSDHQQALLDVARMKAALKLDADTDSSFVSPEGASATQIDLQKNYLTNQVDEIHAKLRGLDNQIKQSQGNLDSVAATITKLTQSIPFLENAPKPEIFWLKKAMDRSWNI